jgi:SAM-dependent methyltransferase
VIGRHDDVVEIHATMFTCVRYFTVGADKPNQGLSLVSPEADKRSFGLLSFGDPVKAFLRKSQFCRTLVRAARELPADIRSLQGTLRRGSIIRQYLDSHATRKLQIGAGPNELAGWLNADFSPRRPSTIFMDATQPFPLPSGSFDLIFSEHMIEHVPFDQGQKMLRECYRVLKPGGNIRIATPNLDRIAALATASPSVEQRRYVSWAIENHVPYALRAESPTEDYRPAYVINNFFWGFGHYFVYDPRTLAAALTVSGFVGAAEFEPGVSDTAELRGLETHAHLIGEEFNRFETMVLQAIKP